MLRGIDKRDIFIEDVDKIECIENIKKAKKSGDFELYGYCLMDNHVHLLIKEHEKTKGRFVCLFKDIFKYGGVI